MTHATAGKLPIRSTRRRQGETPHTCMAEGNTGEDQLNRAARWVQSQAESPRGTGKETIPQIIHQNSKRKHNNYIAVNCGAIPEGTVDSELFGHEKGSFTGANESRKGYFEAADNGTIFLDEIAELPLASQARLLRVLEKLLIV